MAFINKQINDFNATSEHHRNDTNSKWFPEENER